MTEFLKKPYEISIWKDKLISNSESSHFDEEMIAIIGSDTMTSPNRAFSPKLIKNVNGETTLTFSMAHRYYDNELGEEIFNPFTEAGFLVNERKIKLHYKDKWYDFIIKSCEESSEENTFIYTCTDLWVNELSKTGYNVQLAQELANNQGTILELADTVVESSDWIVDHEGSDTIMQWVQEPLFKGTISGISEPIEVIDVLNNGNSSPLENGEEIYFFYSEIINKKTTNITIMRAIDDNNLNHAGKWTFDDNNVAKGPNYRILEIEYNGDTNCPSFIDSETFTENLEFQGYRLNYAPISKYDPVTEKYVDVYRAQYGADDNITYKDIYHYKESQYTTSDVLFNYITNGSNFDVFSGEVEGWYPYASANIRTGYVNNIELSTVYKGDYTSIIPGNDFPDNLLKVEDTDGCIELDIGGSPQARLDNAIYNSGIQDNGSLIGGFTKGEKYVFRAKYNFKENSSANDKYLGLIVAPYEIQPIAGTEETSQYHIKVDKKYFDLTVDAGLTPFIKNNIISGGHFSEDFKTYIKEMSWGDDIIPPSRKYVYYDDDCEDSNGPIPYVWSSVEGCYVEKNSEDDPQYWPDKGEVDSWCIVGECLRPLSAKDIQEKDIGIFIVSSFPDIFYVRELEFFKYIEDANGEMMIPGSAPEATANELDYFYIPDDSITEKEAVETFTSIDAVADYLGVSSNSISQVYNEDCEKIASIEVQESNYFNIIQELCEKFECWAKFEVEHDTNGKITLDANNNPIKKISFHEYVGDDNFAGFKYGINLSSIQRTLDSNEFVSKLIVAQNSNEYVDGGVLTIRNADANALGESYILNFSYYLNQGLIDAENFYQNYNEFQNSIKEKNIEINRLNTLYEDTHMAMTRIAGTLDVYREVLKEANLTSTEGVRDIKKITGAKSYEAYINSDNRTDEGDEAVMDYLAKVLTGDNIESGYAGIAKQLQDEYDKLQEKADGLPSYTITISVTDQQTIVSVSDFVDSIRVTLSKQGQTSVNLDFDTANKIEIFTNYIPETAIIALTSSKLSNSYTVYNTNGDIIAPVAPLEPPVVISLLENTSNLFYVKPNETSDTTSYKAQIDALKTEKDDLEKEFFKKYGRYIQEGTWTSDDYVDNNLYYLDALQISNTSAQPNVTYTINVVEVSEIEGLSNYLFDVGDKTYIEDTEFFGWTIQSGLRTPIREEVIVSEVEWNLDNPEENVITVQNYKTQFEDLFQRVGAAVQSIEYKEGAYNRAASMLDSNGLINSSLLTASLNNISGSKFGISAVGAVYVDRDGIAVTDITKTINQMKLSSKGLMVSDDAGVTWRTIVSPDGIDIGYIKAGIIDAGRINIMDGESTSFRWDKNGISAYSFNNNQTYHYNLTTDTEVIFSKTYYLPDVTDEDGYVEVINPTGNPQENEYYEKVDDDIDTTYDTSTFVRLDKYGLYGIKDYNGSDTFVPSSVEDVQDNASFGITWKGFFIKNNRGDGYTAITEDNDFQVVKVTNTEPIVKIHIGALEPISEEPERWKYGIRIRNDARDVVFETDDEGNAVFNNVSIKGAIRAAVFEYEEIQAIGGIVIVRPSSTIKEIVNRNYNRNNINGTEIILENSDLFNDGDYCRIGAKSLIMQVTQDEGSLSAFYTLRIDKVNDETHYILEGLIIPSNIKNEEIIGSALVSMANVDLSEQTPVVTNNYGIAINSSNSDTMAPDRAITLYNFNVNIDNGKIIGESIDYQSVLGILPSMSQEGKVDTSVYNYMQGTQGIFTDNIYLGNKNEYIAFYDDGEDKKLKIVVNDLYINAGDKGTSGNINDIIEGINNEIENQNSHLLIENNKIVLYSTNNTEQGYEDSTSGIILTSENIKFFTDNQDENAFKTWLDGNSLNSKEIYFERAYPRTFDDPGDKDGKGNLIIMSRSNGHLTIKNIK